ncbi:DNA-processing protein DprA [Candidatus Dojkabacteria bacterium]|nr:DNA-processing protein DprA [Candidatus Dojkabacteria bacterium]
MNNLFNFGLWEDASIFNNGIQIISSTSNIYPKRILAIPKPPNEIYISGNLDLLVNERDLYICITGSRVLDIHVEELVTDTIRRLIERTGNRIIFIIGGARGVDNVALNSIIKYKGKVVVVTPFKKLRSCNTEESQPNILYLWLYPDTIVLQKKMFLQRNWVISSMCHLLIMFKGDIRSGTMSTVHYAGKLGRRVYVNDKINLLDRGYGGNVLLLKSGYSSINYLYEILDICSRGV